MQKIFEKFLLSSGSMIFILLWGCSAQTESPGSGSCSLKCESPKAGASNFGIKLLTDVAAISSQCIFSDAQRPTEPLNGPVQLRYLVYEKLGAFSQLPEAASPSGGGSTAGGGASTGGASGASSTIDIVPRGGIGFEPFVLGQAAVEKSGQGYNPSDKSVTPFKYQGVVTPSAEWCTDTCGVATVEIWPLCIRGKTNDIKAGIFLEGMSGIPSVTISTVGG